MDLTIREPERGIYRATPDYAHAIEVRRPDRFLFVSGTMGLDETGRAPPRPEDQLALIWSNVSAILAASDMTTANVVRVTSYLRNAAYAEANQAARLKALGNRRVPTTAIVVETLRPEWLVEVEVVAAA